MANNNDEQPPVLVENQIEPTRMEIVEELAKKTLATVTQKKDLLLAVKNKRETIRSRLSTCIEKLVEDFDDTLSLLQREGGENKPKALPLATCIYDLFIIFKAADGARNDKAFAAASKPIEDIVESAKIKAQEARNKDLSSCQFLAEPPGQSGSSEGQAAGLSPLWVYRVGLFVVHILDYL
jgi:hypothetical protein